MDRTAVGKNLRRHVTEATASRWVSGQSLPSLYALYRMAKLFGVTMEKLMEGIEGKE